MATQTERNWTAHLVISCEHAGLRPYFNALEDEMYRVLAKVDNPTMVKAYLLKLIGASMEWLQQYEQLAGEK